MAILVNKKPDLAFSIDFEGFVEGMEESFHIPKYYARYNIFDELNSNLDFCLEFLDQNNIEATFFIIGWIAEKYPTLIKNICNNGHEVASHSLYHRRLTNLSVDLVKEYISKSKKILEDISGVDVLGFRAPDFCLPQDESILDYMLQLGYKYDSSIVSTSLHDVYKGQSGSPNIYYYKNGLIEFPVSTFTISKYFSLPVGGGGYFRLYPTFITKYFMKTRSNPIYYIHPYELSGNYPKEVSMSILRKFRHTFNICKVADKTRVLINDFVPISIISYLKKNNLIDTI